MRLLIFSHLNLHKIKNFYCSTYIYCVIEFCQPYRMRINSHFISKGDENLKAITQGQTVEPEFNPRPI